MPEWRTKLCPKCRHCTGCQLHELESRPWITILEYECDLDAGLEFMKICIGGDRFESKKEGVTV